MRPPFVSFALAFSIVHVAAAGAERRVLGSSECVRCHQHSLQAEHWQRQEPAAQGDKAHFNTLEKLKSPRAAELAAKAGVDSPRDSRCTRCHATLVGGRPRSGVSCESCHGPASDYIDVHQKPQSYDAAVQAGLRDLRVKPDNIVKLCVSCHVLSDAQLRAAGHPAGERFDAGASLRKLEHWAWDVRQTSIDYAVVSRLGQPLVAKAAAVPTAAAQTPATAKPPAAAPAPGPSSSAPPARFDPDAAVALPDDYVEASGRRAAPVEDRPVPESLVSRAGEKTRLVPAAPPAAPKPAIAPKASRADFVAARQAALDLLRALLAAGVDVGPLPAPAEYRGPDGELLRLQDEVFALAQKARAAAAKKETRP